MSQNCLIEMGQNVLIYPNLSNEVNNKEIKVRLSHNPVTQKVERGCFSVHFVKYEFKEVQAYAHPVSSVQYSLVKKEDGFMIYYKILSMRSHETIAFAIKGQES